MNKWNLIKLKSFCKEKDTINRTNWHLREWKKIFFNSISDRGIISKYIKKHTKLDINKPNIQTKTTKNVYRSKQRVLNRGSSNGLILSKALKELFNALIHQGNEIKTTLRFNLISVRMAKMNNTSDSSCCWGCRARGTPLHCWWECYYGNKCSGSSENWGLRDLKIQLYHYWACT